MKCTTRKLRCAELYLILSALCGIFEIILARAVIEERNGLDSSQQSPNLQKSRKFKDELRCHCNLPSCVTTGYMCKSSLGTCFSEIVDKKDLSKSRHGCLELLSSKKPEACQNQSESSPSTAGSSVVCCEDDLCNLNVQELEIRIFHSVVKNRSDATSPFEVNLLSLDANPPLISAGVPSQVSSKDLWLKAATIAVPIAGGFILVLLVLLAIRILRRDRQGPNGHYGGHWNSGSDFQIRRVWGKARQQSHQQHRQQLSNNLLWKDMQPMLGKENMQQPRIMRLTMTGNTVYLPTVHTKTWRKDPSRIQPIHHV